MGFKPQTAIRGVFTVALINALARLIAYGKHVIITAYIGLSAQLDAFYVAVTVLSMAIFIFGDVFDSLGIPRLVKTLQEEGEEAFRSLAGSIFSFSWILTAVLCLLLLLVAPWTPWIAPGFSAENKGFVLSNLYLLAPMAILYLPYHAVGSFLRARRRFQAFYVGELLIASSTFAILLIWHDAPYIIPISFSAAYVIIFAYVAAVGMREVRFASILGGEKIRAIVRTMFSLLPLYLTSHLFTLVDRAFASFLPSGGVSALSYGVMITMIPCSVLMLENIFVTPLAESADRGPLMDDILSGVLIVSVPLAVFSAVHAHEIVRAAFERGVFTASSTRMTGEALSLLSLGIPAFFIWPISYRLFQILDKLLAIGIVSVGAVVLNAILNFVFMEMGLGIKGLALATSIAWYALVLGAAFQFRRIGLTIFTKGVAQVFCVSLAVSMVSLAASLAIPVDLGPAGSLTLSAVVYFSAAAALFYFVPHGKIRHVRNTVLREIVSRETSRGRA